MYGVDMSLGIVGNLSVIWKEFALPFNMARQCDAHIAGDTQFYVHSTASQSFVLKFKRQFYLTCVVASSCGVSNKHETIGRFKKKFKFSRANSTYIM